MKLTIGYSPCPNDTFIFHAIASGALQLPGHSFSIQLHDVETLNNMAIKGELDVTKLSVHAWLKIKDMYNILPSGAALGYGCGPILIAKRSLTRNDIPACRIAIPGELTTANLLFSLWTPDAQNKIFVQYNQIVDCIKTGKADCGVIIHESRFTYNQAGFKVVVDLGEFGVKSFILTNGSIERETGSNLAL